MGIEIFRPLGISGITPNINFNPNRYQTNFGNYLAEDTFEKSGPEKYTSETAIKKMIIANPKVKNILKNSNIPLVLNMDYFKELLANHATDVQNIAIGISENLPFSLSSKVNKKALKDAAYLHDMGKVLIPKEILNKNGKLDAKETEIMHKHSELGYELLKTTGLDQTTLNLVKNHHQNAKKTGYPWVSNDFTADINLQILSVADKYSALTEKRAYKDPMSPKQALTIIYADVKEGKLNPIVFKALVNFAKSNEKVAVS